jgi:hypothetical protein
MPRTRKQLGNLDPPRVPDNTPLGDDVVVHPLQDVSPVLSPIRESRPRGTSRDSTIRLHNELVNSRNNSPLLEEPLPRNIRLSPTIEGSATIRESSGQRPTTAPVRISEPIRPTTSTFGFGIRHRRRDDDESSGTSISTDQAERLKNERTHGKSRASHNYNFSGSRTADTAPEQGNARPVGPTSAGASHIRRGASDGGAINPSTSRTTGTRYVDSENANRVLESILTRIEQDAKEEREFNTQFRDSMRAMNKIADASLKRSDDLARLRSDVAELARGLGTSAANLPRNAPPNDQDREEFNSARRHMNEAAREYNSSIRFAKSHVPSGHTFTAVSPLVTRGLDTSPREHRSENLGNERRVRTEEVRQTSRANLRPIYDYRSARNASVNNTRVSAPSIYARSRQHNLNNVQNPADDDQEDKVTIMLEQAFITEEQAGRLENTLPPLGKLGIKAKFPDPYKGSRDAKDFENWLSQLLSWLKLNKINILNDEHNESRLDLLNLALEDKALTFHMRRVDDHKRHGKHLDFSDAILDIQYRFVTRNAPVNAKAKYDFLDQGSRDVTTFYEELKDCAERLVSYPDEYALRNQFMKGLRASLRQEVHRRGFNAENSQLETLRLVAEDIEDADLYEKNYLDKLSRLSQKRTTYDANKSSVDNKSRPSGHKSFSSLRRDDDKKSVSFNDTSRDRHRGRSKSPARAISREHYNSTRNYGKQNNSPAKPSSSNDKSNIVCYKCNKTGHYASDCPTRDGPAKARAVRLDAENHSDDESAQDEEEHESHLYESEYDWDAIVDNEQDGEDEDEGNEPVMHAAAVRIERAAYARKSFAKEKIKEIYIETNVVRRKEPTREGQPTREPAFQRCIETMITVNGLDAKALIDPGSNTDMISPDFARVAKLEVIELVEPIALQLAITGSRSRVNYGTRANIQFGPIKAHHYLDISNVDGYDLILGTPFAWENKCSPIFDDGGYLLINGRRCDLVKPNKPAVVLKKRRSAFEPPGESSPSGGNPDTAKQANMVVLDFDQAKADSTNIPDTTQDFRLVTKSPDPGKRI